MAHGPLRPILGLLDGSVITAKLADLAVTTAKLADLTITSGKLADGIITVAKLATGWPSIRLYRTAVQTIAHNTGTAILWTGTRWKADLTHDGAGANPERITVATAGKYAVICTVEIAPNATGHRQLYLYASIGGVVNAYAVNTQQNIGAVYANAFGVPTLLDLGVGDYVEARVYHDAGVSVNLNVNNPYAPEIMMWLVSR